VAERLEASRTRGVSLPKETSLGVLVTLYSIEPDRWADFLGLGSTKAHDQHAMTVFNSICQID
jgi:hypothetical protein